MKRKYILCAVGFSVLLFSGCGHQQSQTEYHETKETKQLPADSTSGDTDAVVLTAGEAETKVLEHAGIAGDTVTFVKNKLDYEEGRWVYEVEFYTDDHKEYDYEIDAYTGEVISYDYDAEDYTPSGSSDDRVMITEEEAKELALARVSGASASDIREFEIDYDDGRTEYEGSIIYNGMEYEFEIDAYSGAFLNWEEEPVDR